VHVVADSVRLVTPDAPVRLTNSPAGIGWAGVQTFGRLLGINPLMRSCLDRLRRVAARDCTLLIEGDSGTGKELAARAVHDASARCAGPFVVVDCGGMAASALEAELFGGSGAESGDGACGAFVRADGGSIFLDEVSALPVDLQQRLLRVIEHREIKSAGASHWRPLNVRIVAATSHRLPDDLPQVTFRRDLYYRLAVTSVRLPTLAERREDIPLLCQSLLAELGARDGLEYTLDDATLDRFRRREWPGNVRQLRNALEGLVVFGSDDGEPEPPVAQIDEGVGTAAGPVAALKPFHAAKAELVAGFESRYLRTALERQGGNITAAAAAAGVDRVHFLRLLDRHGLRKTVRP
jgi:two-component system response regulator GlrR